MSNRLREVTSCLIIFSSTDAGWSSLAARRAHNPKVVGSNPTPATKYHFWFETSKNIESLPIRQAFFVCAVACVDAQHESHFDASHLSHALPLPYPTSTRFT